MSGWLELSVGVLVGAAVVGLVLRAKLQVEVATLGERVRLLEADRNEKTQRLEEAARREEALRRSLQDEVDRRAAAEAQLEQERRASEEKLVLLQDAERRLADAFRALSAEALRHNNEAFLHLARESFGRFQQAAQADLDSRRKAVEDLVRPLQQEVERVRAYLTEVERQRVEAYGALSQQLRELAESQLPRLHQETANLVKALRQPTARGRWGELQLRRVVEMAGMQAHCDFVEQATAQGEDGRLRPDLVVHLPGGRRVVVDAKAPVDAYLSAVEATEEESRRRFLQQHASQVRTHMANLGRKAYFDQFEVTPDFVVMFIPGEAFFSAALEVDPELIEFGVGQRVIPASPTILIALLKAVAYGWRQEAVAEHAHRIAELGKELYKRIGDLAEHWARVGRRLGRLVEAYNGSVASLESRVLVSARRFEALGAVPAGEALPELRPVEALPRPLTAPELHKSGSGDGVSATADPISLMGEADA